MVKYYIHAADGVIKKTEKKEVAPCALTRKDSKAHKGAGGTVQNNMWSMIQLHKKCTQKPKLIMS